MGGYLRGRLPDPRQWALWLIAAGLVAQVLALAVLAGAPARAQVVHVANYSSQPFAGWKRCTVDRMPPHVAGQVPRCRYVLGRPIGLDLRAIDLQLELGPYEVRAIDLAAASPWAFTRPSLPGNLDGYFGPATLAGAPLTRLQAVPDGAGYLIHYRGRASRMLVGDLWAVWYPSQPGWCTAELLVTASNPAVEDMTATVPAGFRVRWGSFEIVVPGAQGVGPVLLPEGTRLGDGQGRAWPLVAFWRSRMRPEDAPSAAASAQLAICANGVSRLWPDGNPVLPAGTEPLRWTIAHLGGAVARLHGWDAGPLGPAANHNQTGAQHDQVWIGGEAMRGPQSLGAEQVLYLVGLGRAREPRYHREADGSPLDPARHPNLVLWAGRPHPVANVSPDRLGKPRGLEAVTDANGWNPADREHAFEQVRAAALRLTGSPLLQSLFAADARGYLLSDTLDPRLSTSKLLEGEVRMAMWASIVVVNWHYLLEDRGLAAAVDARFAARARGLYLPSWADRLGDLWDVRPDQRIVGQLTGYTLGTMLWQQGGAVWALDYAGRHVGPPELRTLALAGARAVLLHGYSQDASGAWIGWECVGFRDGARLPGGEYVQGRGAYRDGSTFQHTWMLGAPATVLRHEPTNAQARAIWKQHAVPGSWLPPGSVLP